MEKTEKKKERRNLWNFVDAFEGDKVVWMIVILLIMISLVTIFSSTSLLANVQKTDRLSILKEQGIISLLGIGLIVLCYQIRSVRFFRSLSKWGFGFSMLLLLLLAAHRQIIPMIKPIRINDAWRMLSVFGFQIHVFEVVKVLMVLYLSWAVDAYRADEFTLGKRIAKTRHFEWVGTPGGLRFLYIYLPILLVCGLILMGSVSSALFIGAILFVTILIGGMSLRDVAIPGIVAVAVIIGAIGINKISDGKIFNRLDTAASRLTSSDEHYEEIFLNRDGSWSRADRDYARDKLKQPYSAKLAIREGGIFGKGPGQSTQRYVVSIMYSDYMYSFILEEYGLIGGIFIIILFASLLARGARISNWLNNYYAKTAVAGLVILIVGQAFMHMAINLDLVPRTGQTLPMISHGNSSFLAFSIAFGIILSFSREARRNRADRERAEQEAREDDTSETIPEEVSQ